MSNVEAELCCLGAIELGRLYRSGQLSPVDVTKATIGRVERLNPVLKAYITVLSEEAMTAARAAEAMFRAGTDLGALHGVPVSVKDIMKVRGSRTTAASRVLMDASSDTEDATVVRLLRAGGAVIVGKTNLHEFAFGEPDHDNPFGRVENPRRIGYHAGASSSGAGAATAAGLGAVAIGTDTAGSGCCHINSHQAHWGKLGHLTGSPCNAGCRLPCRHSIEAVKVGGKGRAAGTGRNEQVADGREHTDKSL